ncbi:flavin reductase family protein [Amaricoccus solimangrovi]|uniref:Flavin reductase family protein n=1 Tax=Amaricoccus solimangrovi TaxID=2589815 RepID=A0A501WHH4_9RHOB|nr:flavin reductase family protein [Amaricoccus solimangrovi]TPE48808.1 flavin reductase family protein [Amaricoccus solimangrovi]
MFYRPGLDPHGLPHNPFKAIVSPRPIGWISTLDAAGLPNLAPYSFFNAIADQPPMVAYSSTGGKGGGSEGKDTVANIRATGEFVVNIVPMALRDAMNACSAALAHGVDEFEVAGLEKAPCEVVAPPRVRAAPASLECRLWRTIDLPGEANILVIGEVVGVHIDEAMLRDGIFDVTLYQPLSRLGYRDYAAVSEIFPLRRPG